MSEEIRKNSIFSNLHMLNGKGDFDDEVFKFIAAGEGFRPYVYGCPRGVPTIGYGAALLIHDTGSRNIKQGHKTIRVRRDEWVYRTNIDGYLSEINMRLGTRAHTELRVTDKEKILLKKEIAPLVKKHLTKLSTEKIGIDGVAHPKPGKASNFDLQMDQQQARLLFDLMVEREYRTEVARRLPRNDYDKLANTKELVALISMAYNGPARITSALVKAINDDDRDAVYNLILNDAKTDAGRRKKEADMFNGTFVYRPVRAKRNRWHPSKPKKRSTGRSGSGKKLTPAEKRELRFADEHDLYKQLFPREQPTCSYFDVAEIARGICTLIGMD